MRAPDVFCYNNRLRYFLYTMQKTIAKIYFFKELRKYNALFIRQHPHVQQLKL